MGQEQKKKNPLYNPGKALRDKYLKRAANALTRLQYRPQISAYKQDLEAIAEQRKREDRALKRMGNKTTRDIGQTYARTGTLMKQGLAANIELGDQLREGTAANQQASADRMTNLQEGTLGGQLDAL